MPGAEAQTEALAVMERDHALLREHGYAVYQAPRIGVRESNRIRGEYVITDTDLKRPQFLPDTIAIGNYGLDVWDAADSVDDQHVYGIGIPLRALIPCDVNGLLLSGQAISGTHLAMSAYLIMPIAGSIGQAAGVAAALCVQRFCQPRDVEAKEVRTVLGTERQNALGTMNGG